MTRRKYGKGRWVRDEYWRTQLAKWAAACGRSHANPYSGEQEAAYYRQLKKDLKKGIRSESRCLEREAA